MKSTTIDDLRLAERAAFAEWEKFTSLTFRNAGTASPKQYSEAFALRDKWKELARLLKLAEEKEERIQRRLNPPEKVARIPKPKTPKPAKVADLARNTPAPVKKPVKVADLAKKAPIKPVVKKPLSFVKSSGSKSTSKAKDAKVIGKSKVVSAPKKVTSKKH